MSYVVPVSVGDGDGRDLLIHLLFPFGFIYFVLLYRVSAGWRESLLITAVSFFVEMLTTAFLGAALFATSGYTW